jgi:hypothetical protein
MCITQRSDSLHAFCEGTKIKEKLKAGRRDQHGRINYLQIMFFASFSRTSPLVSLSPVL